jgi:hypothetical protein
VCAPCWHGGTNRVPYAGGRCGRRSTIQKNAADEPAQRHPGPKAPDEFNVIIEIPMNADPIKYEVDEETGALFVDRFMSDGDALPVQLRLHPAARIADDGDPVDVLVVTPVPLIPGVVVTLPPAGHAEDGGRGRWRHQAAGRADRQDPVDLHALAEARGPATRCA